MGSVVGLKVDDLVSRRAATTQTGLRLVTVNVNTKPAEVVEAVRSLGPDVIFMQETQSDCKRAAQLLDMDTAQGRDQCIVSRWPLVARPVSWPGPWQPPQVATVEHPRLGRIVLGNVRLALPSLVAALSGDAWYSEAERQDQYGALRELVRGGDPTIVCGDFNAFPFEVDLGPRFKSGWSRFSLGGTFPSWLPAARIDQCWVSSDLTVAASWTRVVPSDHRAVVIDISR